MPKNIQASVGFGGRNDVASVMTVQYLLNCVPAGHGGPAPELAVDGMAGPKTIGAIRKFQFTTFGSADGRVDVGGRTFRALLPYDPAPDQALMPPLVGKMPGPPAPYAKSASYQAAYKDAAGIAGKGAAGKGSAPGQQVPGKSGIGGKLGF